MSQKACLISVDGRLIRKVFDRVPEYVEDLIQILKDNGYTAEGYEGGTENDAYLVYYDCIKIGSDDDGIDHYIDDETLLDLYDPYNKSFEDAVAEVLDVEVTTIDLGEYEIWFEQLMEEDE